MKKKYEPLFQPYTFNNGVQLKNRLVVAPITIYDSGKNGELTPTARNFWQNRFRGFGMFIILICMVFNIINSIRRGDTEKTWFDSNAVAGLVF